MLQDIEEKLDSTEIISEQLWIGSAPSRSDLVRLKQDIGPKLVVVDLTRHTDE